MGWQSAHPDCVLEALSKVKESDFGGNKKEFLKTYKVWDKLNASQQNKAMMWFANLPARVRKNALNGGEDVNGQKKRRICNKGRKQSVKANLVQLCCGVTHQLETSVVLKQINVQLCCC
jgi:hypothetical protein